jgi:hypothetical protein
MEFMQKNVFVPFCTPAIQSLVPVTSGLMSLLEIIRKGITNQELPARLVSCRVKGRICTLAAMAIW